MTDGLWRLVCDRYRAWAGIGLGDRRREPVLVALKALADELGYPTAHELLAAAERADGLMLRDRMVSRLSVGLTWFGRELPMLDAALVAAVARSRAAGLDFVTVWSVGCSSGEEPYTIAMALAERGARPRVLATDISVDALATASRGHYPRAGLGGVPDRWRERYFAPIDAVTVTVAPAIRSLVSFARHNVATDPAPPAGWPRFDLVVCRNVLIYFEPAQIAALVARLGGAGHHPASLLVGAVEQSMIDAGGVRLGGGALRARPASTGRPGSSPAIALAPASPAASAPRPLAATTVAPPVVQAAPLDAVAHLRRGIAARRSNAHDDAIDALRRARLLAAETWLAPYLLGLTLESAGRPSEAVEAYRHAIDAVAHGGGPGLPEVAPEAESLAPTVSAACHARLSRLLDPANRRDLRGSGRDR